jgi:hypothetical protein
MSGRVPASDYPWWVKLGLIGGGGRTGMWAWLALSVAVAAACVAYGLWFPQPLVAVIGGPGFLLAAFMYWLPIRWVDRHGSW